MTLKLVIQKIAPTERGNQWHLFREHPDGSRVTLGFHLKRKAAITVARVLAGWRGKVEVRDKIELPNAWRV